MGKFLRDDIDAASIVVSVIAILLLILGLAFWLESDDPAPRGGVMLPPEVGEAK